jgi:hypothetical protein
LKGEAGIDAADIALSFLGLGGAVKAIKAVRETRVAGKGVARYPLGGGHQKNVVRTRCFLGLSGVF